MSIKAVVAVGEATPRTARMRPALIGGGKGDDIATQGDPSPGVDGAAASPPDAVRTLEPDGFDGAFDDLFALSYRVAYRVLGERQDALDAAQEALSRALARWSRIDARGPEAWVCRVTTNLCIDGIRRRRREPPPPPAHGRDTGAVVSERLALREALGALPRRQREVIALRYLADLSEADTAAALGCSVGSVKQHAHRGLAELRRRMAEVDSSAVQPANPTNGS